MLCKVGMSHRPVGVALSTKPLANTRQRYQRHASDDDKNSLPAFDAYQSMLEHCFRSIPQLVDAHWACHLSLASRGASSALTKQTSDHQTNIGYINLQLKRPSELTFSSFQVLSLLASLLPLFWGLTVHRGASSAPPHEGSVPRKNIHPLIFS